MGVTGLNVFVSGPMTGIEHHNAAAFAEAHAALKEAGAAYVYNPSLRYLTKGRRKLAAMTHDDWVADCLHELTDRERRSQEWVDIVPLKYDLLVQLPGWEASDGAIAEYQVARACGIPVCQLNEVIPATTMDEKEEEYLF